jgi:predicted  nucleic acid-binding Zn-ribbon protein
VSSVNKIEWGSLSNRVIREKLETLKHEHEALHKKMSDLTDYMEKLEIEYLAGNEVLIKRQKGE